MYKIKYFRVILLSWIMLATLLGTGSTIAQGWTRLYIHQLPDTSFALIETDDLGKKYRHCPYRDVTGEVDIEQLIYCLGTLERETWIEPASKGIAKQQLAQHYARWENTRRRQSMPLVAINAASLDELVLLPHVGPVLAVNIVEYREMHTRFETIDDVGKVEGIGQGTLNAIRYYISID